MLHLNSDTSPHARRTEHDKTRRFFNRVGFAFPLIERALLPGYRRSLEETGLDPSLSVLDFGAGTGILASAFAERGHTVKGLDFAVRLLRRARRLHPDIDFELFDLLDLGTLPADSWDLVSMGYLLHGLDREFRLQILRQAARIAKSHVVVFDYGEPGNRWVRLIEWIEGPHYPEFLADSREADFAAAGLTLLRHRPMANSGAMWLCAPGA
jgi:SAM-dependent methyltransferase